MHAEQFYAFLVKNGRQRFCENVCGIKLPLDVTQLDVPLCNFIANVMGAKVDVLGSGLINGVLGHVDGGHIVDEDRSGLRGNLTYFREEIPEPFGLVRC